MDWAARVRAALAVAGTDPDDDVVAELAEHAAAAYQAALVGGGSEAEAEARVSALIARWRADAADLHRPVRRPATIAPPPTAVVRLEGVWLDARYALRLVLRRQARSAAVAVLTLALAIGAATTLFSLAWHALLEPLPWPGAPQAVVLKETRGGAPARFGEVTNAAWLAWREAPATVDALAAWSPRNVTLTGAGAAERLPVVAATPELFAVLGVRPLVGTFFTIADAGSRVVVLSERLWRQRFGADPKIAGRVVRIDDQAYTVTGVLADGLAFPDQETLAILPYEVRPAVDNQLSTLAADVRTPLLVLLAAVGLLLATAIANVAGVQLAGATGRTRELAIRAAIGADAGRVARQLLMEAALLGIAGGAGGLGLALLLHRMLPALLPQDFPRAAAVRVDGGVVAFAALLAIAASFAVGLVPAWRARRLTVTAALAEDGNAPVGGSARTRAGRSRQVVLAGQVAVACVLLIGGVLLGRSFFAIVTADRGYEMDGLLAARVTLPAAMFPDPMRRAALVDGILARIAGVPGVTEVAFTSEVPLTPGGSTSTFELVTPREGTVQVQASPRIVSARVFPALRLRVREGRGFSEADTASAPPVVVVNQAFARRYLGEAPLGARLPLVAYGDRDGPPVEATVVGVVDDVRYVARTSASQPEMYYAAAQMRRGLPVQTVTLLVRTAGEPSALAVPLRTAVEAADPRLVAEAVMPLEARLHRMLARPRLYAAILGGFAAAALIVAAVGLFSLVSYAVSLRARELAIRAALGARRADLLRLVLRQGLGVTLSGLAAGVAIAWWAARSLASELYGVTAYDTLTFVTVPIALFVVAALACALPARRAAAADPLQTLRGGG